MAFRLSIDLSNSAALLKEPGAVAPSLRYVDPDAVRGPARERAAMNEGYAVVPETAPQKLLWERKDEPPELLSHQQTLICNDRFRNLVESFEPNRHQFIPVEIHKRRHGLVGRRYWFNVCQLLDCLDRAHTTFEWRLSHDGSLGYWSSKNVVGARMVFSSARIDKHHLWVDPHILSGKDGLCSQAFGEAAMAAHFKGLHVTPREEV